MAVHYTSPALLPLLLQSHTKEAFKRGCSGTFAAIIIITTILLLFYRYCGDANLGKTVNMVIHFYILIHYLMGEMKAVWLNYNLGYLTPKEDMKYGHLVEKYNY